MMLNKLKVLSLFSGIGAFERSLTNLDIDYEMIGISEWDVNAIISYDAIHTNDGIDYSRDMSKDEILKELESFTFTTDGKKPCDKNKIKPDKLRQLYNANKRSKNLGSIIDIDEKILPEFDLMSWGFCCQDISIAGEQKGFVDEEGNKTRSGLYYDGLRILKYNKPKYSIIENVEALTHKKFKNEFESILFDLEEVGYNNYHKVLNSKNYGVPQNRRRIYIVSIRKDIDDGTFQFPEPFDNGLRLKDFLEKEVDEKYYISEEKTKKLIETLKQQDQLHNQSPVLQDHEKLRIQTSDISNCIDSNYHKGLDNHGQRTHIAIPCITPDRVNKRQNGRRFKEDGDSMFTLTAQDRHGVLLNDNECDCIGRLDNINGHDYLKRVYSSEGCSPTITTVTGGNQEIKILEPNEIIKQFDIPLDIINDNERQRRVYSSNGISPTILNRTDSPKIIDHTNSCKQIGSLGDGYEHNNRVYSSEHILPCISSREYKDPLKYLTPQYRIRKLTEKEAWRLMGFTDEDVEKCKAVGMSRTQMYKCAGNSIVVDVLEKIFENLFKIS